MPNITSVKRLSINGARIAFPSLWETAEFNGKDTERYCATFLIPKAQKELMAEIKAEIRSLFDVAQVKVPRDRWCVQDGDDERFEDWDGWKNNWSLRASSKARPNVYDADRTLLPVNNGRIYSGCLVNAKVNFWLQDNSWGKRINAGLLGVQFAGDAPRFGGVAMATEDDFDVVEGVTEGVVARGGEPVTADDFSL